MSSVQHWYICKKKHLNAHSSQQKLGYVHPWSLPAPPHPYNKTRPPFLSCRRPKPQKSSLTPLTCHVQPLSQSYRLYLQNRSQCDYFSPLPPPTSQFRPPASSAWTTAIASQLVSLTPLLPQFSSFSRDQQTNTGEMKNNVRDEGKMAEE